MDQEREGRPGNPRLLTAISLQAAGLASPLPVLLFRREEIAEHLNLLGAIVGEATLLGAVAVLAALGVPRLRDKFPAGALLFLGGLMAAVGLALMASADRLGPFVVGGVLLALGSAPGLVTHRILVATDTRSADRFRTLSWYWAAVAERGFVAPGAACCRPNQPRHVAVDQRGAGAGRHLAGWSPCASA